VSRIKVDCESSRGSRSNGGALRLDSKAGVRTFFRFQSLEIKFEGIFALVKALILSDRNFKWIYALLVKLFLIE
jgi:hypothetical protein